MATLSIVGTIYCLFCIGFCNGNSIFSIFCSLLTGLPEIKQINRAFRLVIKLLVNKPCYWLEQIPCYWLKQIPWRIVANSTCCLLQVYLQVERLYISILLN